MKRILKYISFIIISYFILLSSSYAASLSLSRSSASVSNGGTVKITAQISGAQSYTASNFSISYDQEKFAFVSAGGSGMCNGLNCIIDGNGSMEFTFRAKNGGTGTFSASGVFEDDTAGNIGASTSVTVGSAQGNSGNNNTVTNNTNLSSNNNLSTLTIEGYDLNPSFNKDTTEYSLTVPSDVTQVTVGATTEDKGARVTGAGKIDVSEGVNTIEIIVTAANGNKKSYAITVTVEEKNPIEVKSGKKKLTVVRNKDLLQMPNNYEEKTIKIDGEEVPAFYSELTKLTLVGLKDEKGNINLYIYDKKKKNYDLYKEANFNNIRLYPKDCEKAFKGYKEYTIDVAGNKVKAYKLNKDSKRAIVYGMDLDTGKYNYYMYDIDNNTIQLYNDEHVKELYASLDLYGYIILGAAGVILLLFIIIIILCISNSKRKKKIKYILNKIGNAAENEDSEIVDEEAVVDEVIEQDEEDEMYNLLDD